MPFKLGVSGNPGGRPKADLAYAEIVRAKYCPAALERLVHWMNQDDDPAVSMRAALAIHEIGYGRTPQAIALNAASDGPIEFRFCWADGTQVPEPSLRG
jgi:hypothetical protein